MKNRRLGHLKSSVRSPAPALAHLRKRDLNAAGAWGPPDATLTALMIAANEAIERAIASTDRSIQQTDELNEELRAQRAQREARIAELRAKLQA